MLGIALQGCNLTVTPYNLAQGTPSLHRIYPLCLTLISGKFGGLVQICLFPHTFPSQDSLSICWCFCLSPTLCLVLGSLGSLFQDSTICSEIQTRSIGVPLKLHSFPSVTRCRGFSAHFFYGWIKPWCSQWVPPPWSLCSHSWTQPQSDTVARNASHQHTPLLAAVPS